jgi:hypothetical protein
MLPPEPKYELYSSVQEMLSNSILSSLLGRPVDQVLCQPFKSTNGFSGNQLYHVTADQDKLVMKRLRPEIDWLAISSKDDQCRSVRVWQYGLLDKLLPYIQHAILAACQDGDEYCLLMRDVSGGLLNLKKLSQALVERMLDALARMHAGFWEDDLLQNEGLGLSSIRNKLSYLKPLPPEYFSRAPLILEIIQKGHTALLELVDQDVRTSLQSLFNNSLALENFMAQLPKTLVHCDFRQDNLAFYSDTQDLVVFDWQSAAYAPLTEDLCWFIGSLADHLDLHPRYYEYYYQRIKEYQGSRLDPQFWQRMLEVGCLVEVMTKGVWHAYFALYHEDIAFRTIMRKSVNSYNEIVRKAVRWL